MADTPLWLNGEPYYCAVCGAGLGEYQGCEMPDCRLETKAEAEERARAAMDDRDGAEPLEIEESKAVYGQADASDTPSRINADYTQSGMAATAPVTKDPTP